MTDTAPRPQKSEQLQASEEITEVAPGILRTQLPANLTGLGHVNIIGSVVFSGMSGTAIADADGGGAIDAGQSLYPGPLA